MFAKNFIFLESTNITSAGTTYTGWFEADEIQELLAFLELTAQTYDGGDTINITLQTMSPNGNAHDIGSFSEVTDATGSLPYYRTLARANIGSLIRFKIVVVGTTPDYTFSLTGKGKRG